MGLEESAQPANPLPYVFKSGTDGYHTFRIPAIVRTPKGTLVAFAEGRVHNWGDHGDIDIVAKRSTGNGKTWSDLIIVQDDKTNTCGNPAPVVDEKTGTIILLSCGSSVSEGAVMDGKGTREVYVQFSKDEGKTWSPRRNISKEVRAEGWRWYATGPCSGIQIRQGKYKGRLVIPANHSDENKKYRSHSFYSDDLGVSWHLGSSAGDGSNESQIVETAPDTLVQNMRMQTNRKGVRATRTSHDGGATWSELQHEESLPCPRCQGSVVKDPIKNGFLYFSNPSANPPARKNMGIRVSMDQGKTWPYFKTVFEGPSGYSNLVILGKSSIGILFEGGTKDLAEGIAFLAFSKKSLLTKKD